MLCTTPERELMHATAGIYLRSFEQTLRAHKNHCWEYSTQAEPDRARQVYNQTVPRVLNTDDIDIDIKPVQI